MAKIFISYKGSDKSTAYRLCEYLESRGLECWIAPRDTHAGEYADAIARFGIFAISAGVQTNQFKYLEANAGIGVLF